MNDLTPRRLQLIDCQEDGEETRHYHLRIEQPRAEDLAAVPGQFFMLTVPGCGEAPFTYVRLPDGAGYFEASIRRVGALTAALFALQPGAVLGYRGPFGQGWPLLLGVRRVLIVAGGCGLAPLASVLDEAARHALPLHLSVLYGARHGAARILRRERARWQRTMPFIETFDQAAQGQRQGTVLVHLDEFFADQPPDALFVCGPEGLMRATAEACLGRGLAAEKIWLSVERRMQCAVGLCGHCYLGASYACVDGPTYRYDRYRALARCP